MGLPKGRSGNYKGRPPGNQKRIDEALKMRIRIFLRENQRVIDADTKNLNTEQRDELIGKLLFYAFPELRSREPDFIKKVVKTCQSGTLSTA